MSTLGLGYPCLKKLQARTRCISFPLLQQCQGSAGLADDLALVRSQIHEFKSVTIAGAAAQDSSNPDRAARDRNGEFQADHCADFPFRDKYSSRPGFADIERPAPHRGAFIRGGHVEFRVNFVARIPQV